MWWFNHLVSPRRRPGPKAWIPAFAGMTLLLASCGFQLRGETQVGVPSMAITRVHPSPVALDIRRLLEQGTTKIVADPKLAAVNLRILGETRDKTVYTITGTG